MNANEQAHIMLRDLESPRERLTKWELGFLESISEQLDDGKQLSENQLEKLKSIHGEKS